MSLLGDIIAIPQTLLSAGAALDPTGITGAVLGLTGLGTGASPLSPAGLIGSVLDAPTDLLSGLTGGLLGGAAATAAASVDTTGFGGGNGSVATRTVVETMDLKTGAIVRRRVLPGSPFLMNSEIKAAKKVFRQSAALAKRIPRKTVKESATTQLKEAAIQAAIRNASSGGECRDIVVKT